ncbi:MAG TPA: acetyl-CoA hydrolase/transferase C-terminal domain-containing protein [Polyangiales bacterium]|nr:acetyl-CoA hydrolase/transferase C-terminal domain-containing protein [Polyangiales bacterium]
MPPELLRDPDTLIDRVLTKLGARIVLGTPLGIGKPNALLNALYRRARADRSIQLDIITALSLNPPRGKSELEERFYEPIRARVWGDYPRLDYLDELERLPSNVRVIEFYCRAGAILGNAGAQQNYISSNYSHVARDMMSRGVNLVMQAVSERDGRYSLSGNPDVTLMLLPLLERSDRNWLAVAQVNRQLPWFGHAAELKAERAQLVLDDARFEHAPFAVPHEPVDDVAWAIGLRAAALVKDGGTLQVGIGALGDAACHALLVRDRDNATFGRMLDGLGRDNLGIGDDGPFNQGLYVASELISNPLFALFEAGIVRRRVYEDKDQQEAALRGEGPSGGTAIQGAFFVGPADFYRRLHELPEAQRELVDMNSVGEVNRIYTHYTLEHLQRKSARFINMTLKINLLGAATSDQLEDGKVLSGVGGQSDFVNMAHQLPDGRSILLLRAASSRAGKLESNIVWQYGHTTVPRHMRDVFATEYGVADLRGKTDRECIEGLLAIADSRLQDSLLSEAKRAQKVPQDTVIPEQHRNNTPERIRKALAPYRPEVLPDLPFGSDLTAAEWKLAGRLKKLASTVEGDKLALARAMAKPADGNEVRAALQHLALDRPQGAKEQLLARLVRAAYAL